jgi:DNA repair protein RadC
MQKQLKQLFTVQGMVKEDTPTYKQFNMGNKALTDAELIASILGKRNMLKNIETAKIMLKDAEYNLRVIARHGSPFITKYFNWTQASQIMAALEIGSRTTDSEFRAKRISNSRDIFDIIQPKVADINVEEFYVIHLNKANVIIDQQRCAIGGISGVVVDVRIILKQALQLCATGIIAAHNHPSGNLNPSDADVAITKKLKEAAALMDISLLDHVIISGTANGYYSFADNGII